MPEMILAAKVLSLSLAMFFGLPWIGMLMRGQAIHWLQTAAVTAGVVGFIALQGWI